MADLIIEFGPCPAAGGAGPVNLPALLFDDALGGRALLLDCASFKRTDAPLPVLDQGGFCPVIMTAKGGGLWVAVGDGTVAATVAGAGCLYIPENASFSRIVRGGRWIAAINA